MPLGECAFARSRHNSRALARERMSRFSVAAQHYVEARRAVFICSRIGGAAGP
jgi:hypothetical protein